MRIIQGTVSNLHSQIYNEATGKIVENHIDENQDNGDLVIDYDFDIDGQKFYGFGFGHELLFKNGDEVIVCVQKNNYVEYIINITKPNGERIQLMDGTYKTSFLEALVLLLASVLCAYAVINMNKSNFWLILPVFFFICACRCYKDYRTHISVIRKMHKMADLRKQKQEG